jgi:hypothetical protein
MADLKPGEPGDANICLECGLCCNGVIFADVKLRAGDNPEKLKTFGLSVGQTRAAANAPRLKQPCAAFAQGRCRIYAERPACCRAFECLLFKNLQAGKVQLSEARRVIATALQRAEKVGRLLRELGNGDEGTALGARFRRTAKSLERAELDERTAGIYAELTLAVHDLNLLVKDAFYPGLRPAARGCRFRT